MANTADHSIGSIVLSGSSASLEPGDHSLVNLLVPGDTLNITVTPGYEIMGIRLDGYEVAIYEISGTTDDGSGHGSLPDAGYRLGQNYPNPFNPSTKITFDLPRAEHVKLDIFNIKGELVTTIIDQYMSEGRKEVSWTATGSDGREVSSGVYCYRLVSGEFVQTKKMVPLR